MSESAEIPSIPLNSGDRIPLLGLGTWPMIGDECERAVATAIEQGYRLIDTAARYENEEAVGRGVVTSGIDREDCFVVTKLRGSEHGKDKARIAVESSLERLGLDYVDGYLIHWPLPRLDKYVESYATMIELRDAGLIRSVGVSNFKRSHVDRLIAETGVTPALDQIELSPAIARVETRKQLTDLGIVVQSWSPLGLDDDVPQSPVVRRLAETYGRTPGQVILRWHVQQGLVAVPKSADKDRQRENAAVFDFELTVDDFAALGTLDKGEQAAVDSDQHEEF
jgi:2,5-diketo-D-gluconate reductase A